MEKITRTMRLDRVTKGAVRFAEDAKEGEPEAIGSIYLKKWALGKGGVAKAVAGLKVGDYDESQVTISMTVDVN